MRIPLRLLHRFERAAAFDIPTKQGSDTGRVVGGLFPLLEDEVRRAQSLVWGVRIVAGKAECADENAAAVAEIRAIGDGVPAPNFGFRARGICMRRLRVSTWSPDRLWSKLWSVYSPRILGRLAYWYKTSSRQLVSHGHTEQFPCRP